MQLSSDDSTSITKLKEGKEKKRKWPTRRVGFRLSRQRLWMKRGKRDGVVSDGAVGRETGAQGAGAQGFGRGSPRPLQGSACYNRPDPACPNTS